MFYWPCLIDNSHKALSLAQLVSRKIKQKNVGRVNLQH